MTDRASGEAIHPPEGKGCYEVERRASKGSVGAAFRRREAVREATRRGPRRMGAGDRAMVPGARRRARLSQRVEHLGPSNELDWQAS